MSFHLLIPAAGSGKRMAADIPKQYLRIGQHTLLDWTLSRMLALEPRSLLLVLAQDDPFWPASAYAGDKRVELVEGGEERCHSVLNGLNHLLRIASPEDWVLVHDAARPCVPLQDIRDLIAVVQQKGQGGLLGMPVHDTMKRTDGSAQVLQTIDRSHLWHAFTPQMFRIGQLRDALSQALDAGALITDEASAMEWAGFKPLMVEGSSANIKVTRPADLALAAYYLNQAV